MAEKLEIFLPLQFRLEFFDLGADGVAAFAAATGLLFLAEEIPREIRHGEGDEDEGGEGLERGRHEAV